MPAAFGFVTGLAGFAAPAIGSTMFGGWAFGAAVGSTVLGGIAGKLLTTVAVSALQAAVASTSPQGGGITITTTLRGEQNPETIILGWTATSGQALAPPYSHGKNNRFLTHIVELCSAPGATMQRLVLGDDYAELGDTPHPDYGLPVIGGDYEGLVWVKYYDGSQVAADPMLLDRYGDHPDRPWGEDMVGNGLCYAILTFRLHKERLTQVPRYRFEMLGIPLYDVSQDSTAGGAGPHRWDDPATWEQTVNPAVIVWNLKRGIRLPGGDIYGGQIAAADLPGSVWMSAMNACDTGTPLSEGGSEPRYRGGLEVALTRPPAEAVEEFLKACAGAVADIGGTWKIRVGGPALPVYTFTDKDVLRSRPEELDPFPTLKETWNAVAAVYPDPEALWEPRDAPPRYNEEWEAADVFGRRTADLTLPAAPYSNQVQRLMRAWIEDERRFIRHMHSLPPDATVLEPLDTAGWSSQRNGYDGKDFEVSETLEDLRTCIVQVSKREVDPSDYSWHPDFELPSPPITTGTTPLPPDPVSGWGAEPAILTDEHDNPRRGGVRAFWDSDIIADGLRLRVRAHGDVGNGWTIPVNDVEAGEYLIFEKVLPGSLVEIRARLIVGGRLTEWTDWVPVLVPNIGVGLADLADEVGAAWQAALDDVEETALEHGIQPVADLPEAGAHDGQIVLKMPQMVLYRWDAVGETWSTDLYAGIPDGAVTIAKHAAGLEPVMIVDAGDPLPAGKLTEAISWQGKLYRWSGEAYTAAVPAADVAGQLTDAQLAALDAAKLLGTMSPDRIGTGAILSAKLADAAVTVAKLANNAVTSAKLADAAVTVAKVANNAVTSAKLADAAVTVTKVANNAVASAKLADAAVTVAKVADAAIGAAKLADTAVVSSKLADAAVLAAKIADGAVVQDKIAAGAVVASKILVSDFENLIRDPDYAETAYWQTAQGSGSHISQSPSTSSNFPAATVVRISNEITSHTGIRPNENTVGRTPVTQGDQFYQSARYRGANSPANVQPRMAVGWYGVDGVQLSSSTVSIGGAVGAGSQGSVRGRTVTAPAGAVTARWNFGRSFTADAAGNLEIAQMTVRRLNGGELIVDGAITALKIAANTITAAHIVAATITAAELASNSVTAVKIATNTITAAHIVGGTITAAELASNSVTAVKIATNSITTAKVAAGAITAAELASSSVTAVKIAANTITAAHIVGGTITAAELASNSVTAVKIAANTITAAHIVGGTITAAELASNSVTTAKIAAGAVTANEIAAGAIVARVLAASDWENLVLDPNYETPGMWGNSGGSSAHVSQQTSTPENFRQATGMQISAAIEANTLRVPVALPDNKHRVPCSPGERFYQSALFRGGGSGISAQPRMAMDWYNKAGDNIGTNSSNVGGNSNTTPTVRSRTVTAPAGAVALRYRFGRGNPATANGTLLISEMTVRRLNGGELIVDGAITANKIEVGSVTANHLAASSVIASKIAGGAITADKLAAANVITLAAQISNGIITTAKIGDAQITTAKIANTIQSNNFTAGSVGWRIQKGGNAQFNNLVVRGWLQVGAASDIMASHTAGQASQSGGLTTINTLSLGNSGEDQVWLVQCYCENNGAVQLRFQYRQNIDGDWTGWSGINSWSLSFGAGWRRRTAAVLLPGGYEGTQIRLQHAGDIPGGNPALTRNRWIVAKSVMR